MKEKLSSAFFTFLLSFILILLLVINIFVFVSGPSRKAQADQQELFSRVISNYQLTEAIYIGRHAHHRITYIAFLNSEKQQLVFYDEDGLIFLLIDVPPVPQLLNELIDQGIVKESSVTYGYFDVPVFVIDTAQRLQYIDFSGKSVFYLRKGQ